MSQETEIHEELQDLDFTTGPLAEVFGEVDNDSDDDSDDDNSDVASTSASGAAGGTTYTYVPQNSNFGERWPKIKPEDCSPFPHGYNSDWWGTVFFQPVPLEEQRLIAASESIRSKPEWWVKMDNAEIVARWKREMVEQGLREEIAAYVIDELDFYRSVAEPLGFKCAPVLTREIMLGSGLVSSETKQQLRDAVRVLEDVPEAQKDWHPGSNKQVLDLVHPSLFPVVYGKTRVLNEGEADITPANLHPSLDTCHKCPVFNFKTDLNKNDVDDYAISLKYQWLPTPFAVDESGSVSVASYINNLHPEWHKEMYPVLCNVFSAAVGPLNHTLRAMMSGQPLRINPSNHRNGFYSDSEPDFEDENGEWDDEKWEDFTANRVIPDSNPEPYVRPELKPFDCRGTTLNVITKLASIHLTPENPSYPGGSWHVEGTINENIVATILYYYDMDNVTESRLSFRTCMGDPEYEQGDVRGVREIYGIEDEQVMNLGLGSVEALEDRVVVFPNLYQHKVEPFELQDKTRSGHRKIVCFFVCDPSDTKVHTTARVPPQNIEWWGEKVRSIGPLNNLPDELFQKVLQANDDFPWTLDVAKTVREDLMAERTASNKHVNEDENGEAMYARQFSLCEH